MIANDSLPKLKDIFIVILPVPVMGRLVIFVSDLNDGLKTLMK